LTNLLSEDERVRIDELAVRFDVSPMTIRRDLEWLEAQGLARRVRGGAVAIPAPSQFGDRRNQRLAEKREIARKARSLIPMTGTIALDASTTINMLAETIGGRAQLTVCTNASQTFHALSRLDGVQAILTGGTMERSTGSLVGPFANQAARALRTDVCFLSAAALDVADGGSEVSVAEAEIKQTFADRAELVVMCVDSTKLGKRAAARSVPLEMVSVLVTELNPSDPRLAAYRRFADIL